MMLSKTSEMKLAFTAAQTAGKLLMKGVCELTPDKISYKSAIDLVTEYDQASENIIMSILSESQIPIFAEESQIVSLQHLLNQKKDCWIVDPLDGTTNFSHGFPHYSISIALMLEGRVEIGLVFNPNTNEMFAAKRGNGAWCNNQKIKCSDTTLEKALLLTGFPYDRRIKTSFYLRYFEEFLKVSQGIRRPGSAALDLAYVAAGRANGFWEFGLQPWDVAAGLLLVQEAGGQTSDLCGSLAQLNGPHLLAAPPNLHKEMLERLKKFEPHECQL